MTELTPELRKHVENVATEALWFEIKPDSKTNIVSSNATYLSPYLEAAKLMRESMPDVSDLEIARLLGRLYNAAIENSNCYIQSRKDAGW